MTSTSQLRSNSQTSDLSEDVLTINDINIVIDHDSVIDNNRIDTNINSNVNANVNDINTNKTSLNDIGLNVVLFNRIFSRNRGTLSQIVKSLSDMYDRLSTPVNEYQKILYPHIQQECLLCVDEYTKLVNSIDKNDYNVFGFYLNGPYNNGRRKITSTIHEQKSYGVSEYKETLRSINDRLRHIKTDCFRKNKLQTHIGSINTNTVFNRIIIFCDSYHKIIVDRLNEWTTFITHHRKTNETKYKSIDQHVTQPINQPINQSINKPINKPSRNRNTNQSQNKINTNNMHEKIDHSKYKWVTSNSLLVNKS